jgi:hypothetical protein
MQNNMLQEGQEILEGRFKIMKKLGCGAFGEIFKGKLFFIKPRCLALMLDAIYFPK